MKNLYILIALFSIHSLFAQINNDSFTPIPGEKYIISAWVKDKIPATSDQYLNPGQYEGKIQLLFDEDSASGGALIECLPTGIVIDGWQRIIKEFVMPVNVTVLKIKLVSQPNGDSFFDDVRFVPFNGNLKSFVYDPENQRLMAELDENNYATFYEYDAEGGLVRVKKETERGVYTIQETRSGNSKLNTQQ